MKRPLLLFCTALIAVPAAGQLPGLSRRGPQPVAPVLNPLEALRADFAAQSGGTSVYFAPGSAQLTAQGRTTLSGQALWLRQNPGVPVRIEGRGDPTDTRDHALALGAERAEEARAYLLLLGVPSAQMTAMSWGKERPGPPSATTSIAQ